MSYILGVRIGPTELNCLVIAIIETLLGCFLGLVTVEASSYIFSLVHYTLQEYLSDNTELFHSPDEMIAEICSTCLNF